MLYSLSIPTHAQHSRPNRKASPNQQRGLINTMMLITQHPHSPRIHHQTHRKTYLKADPALRESSRGMTMRDQYDILRLARSRLDQWTLYRLVLGDERVDAILELRWGLAAFAAVAPDVPFAVLVEAFGFAARFGFLGGYAFVFTGRVWLASYATCLDTSLTHSPIRQVQLWLHISLLLRAGPMFPSLYFSDSQRPSPLSLDQ